MDNDRREFLEQAAMLLAGVALGSCKPNQDNQPSAGPTSQDASTAPAAAAPIEHAFKPPQRAAFSAACARIIPTDHEPGAKEANCVEYLDRELARPEFAKLKAAMLSGVVALDRVSQRLGNKLFVDLAPVEQDEVIYQVQRQSDRGQDFVKFLVVLTIEGFAADPIYGGNQGGVGWKFTGYGPGASDGSGVGAHGHGGHH